MTAGDFQLKRREWDSNPRWSYPHTRFPSVLLQPLGHLSVVYKFKRRTHRLYHIHPLSRPCSECYFGLKIRGLLVKTTSGSLNKVCKSCRNLSTSIPAVEFEYWASLARDFVIWARPPKVFPRDKWCIPTAAW